MPTRPVADNDDSFCGEQFIDTLPYSFDDLTDKPSGSAPANFQHDSAEVSFSAEVPEHCGVTSSNHLARVGNTTEVDLLKVRLFFKDITVPDAEEKFAVDVVLFEGNTLAAEEEAKLQPQSHTGLIEYILQPMDSASSVLYKGASLTCVDVVTLRVERMRGNGCAGRGSTVVSWLVNGIAFWTLRLPSYSLRSWPVVWFKAGSTAFEDGSSITVHGMRKWVYGTHFAGKTR